MIGRPLGLLQCNVQLRAGILKLCELIIQHSIYNQCKFIKLLFGIARNAVEGRNLGALVHLCGFDRHGSVNAGFLWRPKAACKAWCDVLRMVVGQFKVSNETAIWRLLQNTCFLQIDR